MHQTRHTTHEVRMEILNLKVIDQNRFIKNLNSRAKNCRSCTVEVENLITDSKVTSGNPTLINHIERVVCGRVDVAFIGVEVQNLINRVDINLCYGLEFGFSGFNVLCPKFVTYFNFVYAFLPTINCYKRSSRKSSL